MVINMQIMIATVTAGVELDLSSVQNTEWRA